MDSWFSDAFEAIVKFSGTDYIIQTSWDEVCKLIVPRLFADREERLVLRSVVFGLLLKIVESESRDVLKEEDCIIDNSSEDIIRAKLITKNIITVVTEQRIIAGSGGSVNTRVWKMTEHGRLQLSLLIG